MKELKNYYDEPIRVVAATDDEFEQDFLMALVDKYGRAIRRAAQLGGRYIEAVQTLLDMEWSMVYGSVYRDFTSHVTINVNKSDGDIRIFFTTTSIY